MSKLATSCFNEAIISIAKDCIKKHGFKYSGKRKFLMLKNDIYFGFEFQLGQRANEDKFTVNIVVGDDNYRLGFLRKNLGTKITELFKLDERKLLARVICPGDKWWKIDAWNLETSPSVKHACKLIENIGIPWLQSEMARKLRNSNNSHPASLETQIIRMRAMNS
jgi:hypothetical protein